MTIQLLEAIIKARDEMTPVLKSLNQSVASTKAVIDNLTNTISGSAHDAMHELAGSSGQLGVALGALGPIGIAAAAAIGGVFEAVEKSAEYAHSMEMLSVKTGVGVVSLQEFGFAAKASGADVESISGLMTKMDSALARNSAGFEKLGLDAAKLKHETPEQAFRDTAAALAGVNNQMERVAIAKEVFGKAGAEALPFIENMEHLTEVSRQMGLNLADDDVKALASVGRAGSEAGQVFDGLTHQFAAGVVGSTDLAASFESLAPMISAAGVASRTLGEALVFTERVGLAVATVGLSELAIYLAPLMEDVEYPGIKNLGTEAGDAAKKIQEAADQAKQLARMSVVLNPTGPSATITGPSDKEDAAQDAAIKKHIDGLKTLEKQAQAAAVAYQQYLTSGVKDFFNEVERHRTARETFDLLGKSAQDLTIEMGRLANQVANAGGVSDLTDNQLKKVIEDLKSMKTSGGSNAWGIETLNQALTEAARRGGEMAQVVMKEFDDWHNENADLYESMVPIQAMLLGIPEDAVRAMTGGLVPEMGKAETAALSLGDTLKSAFQDLPGTIMSAIQGGGDVLKSVGSLFGSKIFGAGSSLVTTVTGGLTSALGKTVGGALGSIIPGLGTILGSGLGSVAGKIFGSIFGGEASKVAGMRDDFLKSAGGIEELTAKAEHAGITLSSLFSAKKVADFNAALENVKTSLMRQDFIDAAGGLDELKEHAAAAGVTLDAMMNASTVKGYEGAVKDLQAAMQMHDDAVKGVNDAMQKYGITVDEMGPKWAKQELDKKAMELLKDYELLSAAGADQTAVIEHMGPALNAYVDDCLKAGVAIPENMKPALQKMAEMGLLTDENGQKITDVSKLNFTKDLTTQVQDLVQSIKDLVDALRGIPKNVDTSINVSTNIPGAQGANPGAGQYVPNVPTQADIDRMRNEHHAAQGFSGWVNAPTRFLTGEGGEPEHVEITPRSKMGGSGDGGAPQILHADLHIDGVKFGTVVTGLFRTNRIRINS